MVWLNRREVEEARNERRLLELAGDNSYREPVLFLRRPDGSLYVYVDGGETGDTEAGFYSIEADRTFGPDEVKKLRDFLEKD